MRPRRISLDGKNPFKNVRQGQQFQVEARGISPFKGEAVFDGFGRLYFRPMLNGPIYESNKDGVSPTVASEPVHCAKVTTLFFLDQLARKASP